MTYAQAVTADIDGNMQPIVPRDTSGLSEKNFWSDMRDKHERLGNTTLARYYDDKRLMAMPLPRIRTR